ncbi:MAG: redoxin domain-containing protein [Nevskia sp.]|nr:redoxin domain-containing protein [Nevskia sp.]
MKAFPVFVAAAALLAGAAHAAPGSGDKAPEFTHHGERDWLNSPPLTLAGLRGSVVLVDFWAFECWNCYRSFPWLNAVGDKYRQRGLRVVSVHTPELPAEHDRDELVRKAKQYGLTNPVMLDDDSSYWNAMGNSYWPAFYLIDRHGALRAAFVGETHAGDDNARAIEAAVEQLLAEPPR